MMNLKQKLEDLKNNLNKYHDYIPGNSKEKGKKTTRPIDILINFIESNHTVREELVLAGLDWPEPVVVVAEPVAENLSEVVEIDAIVEEIASSVAETANIESKQELLPSNLKANEILFKYQDRYYKRNIYSGTIWEWITFFSNTNHNVWNYLGVAGKLTCDNAKEIEAASYAAMSTDAVLEKSEATAVAAERIPVVSAYNAEDYLLFFTGSGESKKWFRIHKGWHSIWEHNIKKNPQGVEEDDWNWLGYPNNSNYSNGKVINSEINLAAEEAIKERKKTHPDDKVLVLIGEKQTQTYYGGGGGNYYGGTSNYVYHEDKEAPIDIETAILVDENLPQDDDDIGKLKGEFSKKNESKYQGFHSSPRIHTTTNTYFNRGGTQSESSSTFPERKPALFPSSAGTVTPASSVRVGNSNSDRDNDNGVVPLYGGYERRIVKPVAPLTGYGDAIKVGDWVVVYFEQDKQKPVLEYDGRALKVISYSSEGYIDLMHEDESVTKTLYRGPNWCKTFKVVPDSKKNNPIAPTENIYDSAPDGFWDADLPPMM
jgi:hypothetical protein